MIVRRCRKVGWSDILLRTRYKRAGGICSAKCLTLDTKVNNSSRLDLLWGRILVSGPKPNEGESFRVACMYWVVGSMGESRKQKKE